MGNKKTTGKSKNKKGSKKPAPQPKAKVQVSADGLNINIQIQPPVQPKEITFEIGAVVDRSGSMASMKAETITAFNKFVESQINAPGKANMTTVLFDSELNVLYHSRPIENGCLLNESNYTIGGYTALLDAIGKTIELLDAKNTNDVILVILTDGEENSSRYYTDAQIKQMLAERQKRGWNIQYLAASADKFTQQRIQAYYVGALGAAPTATKSFNTTHDAYAHSAQVSASYRASRTAAQVPITAAQVPITAAQPAVPSPSDVFNTGSDNK